MAALHPHVSTWFFNSYDFSAEEEKGEQNMNYGDGFERGVLLLDVYEWFAGYD
jgi:hypothetical protein